jgi:site-specific DNA recombinase
LTPQILGRKPRLVGYARVSTEKQGAEGASLEAQKAHFEAYAEDRGAELVDVVADAQSGKNTEREGLQRALQMLEAGTADGILVTKLDRLTRSVRDFAELLDDFFTDRFVLHCVEDTVDTKRASGRMFLFIKMAFSQYERELGVERTRDTLRHLSEKGGGTPRVPAVAAARIAELAAGGASLRAICTHLTNEGIPTTKGGLWAPETVRKVLKRAR